MQRSIRIFFASLCLATGVRALNAATWYVDFSAGSDAGAGTTAATAWKHAPGDPAAQGAAAKTNLAPGDTVTFKGGVDYKGNLMCRRSGETGKPIVYDGNIAGKWGTGKAIIDGSENLTGWTPCASAEDCGGNPNWKNIQWAYAPAGVTAASANLTENGKLVWLSEDPKQPDPFFMEKIENFYTIPNKDMTITSIVDPVHLNQKDPHYWDDASIAAWATPNFITVQKIDSFDPASSKITFKKLGGEPYRDRPERYCLYNSIHLITQPAEYYFNDRPEPDGRHKVYLWPRDPGDLNQQQVTVSIRHNGFDLADNAGYITIQGFKIQLFSGIERNNGLGVRLVNSGKHSASRGIIVKDNLITHIDHPFRGYGGVFLNGAIDSTVEGNQIIDNPGGIGILIGGGDHVTLKDNLVKNPGSQAIWFMGCKNSRIVGNTVIGALGTHANGISVYSNSSDILVFGNRVTDSNIAFTMEKSKRLTIACNIFDGSGKAYAAASWGNVDDVKVYNNDFVNGSDSTGLTFNNKGNTGVVVKNNIISGLVAPKDADVSHNLYTAKNARQGPLHPGELVETDMNKIFVDPAKGDFHLKPGSPAIGAGVDVGEKTDITGAALPAETAPDIGAYQHETGAPAAK